MAINFGQQINQALGQSLNRVADSRVRARQLAEQMKERQFNQQMQQMVQDLREREHQLAREAQTEKIMQQAFERQIARDREERLGELTDARIDSMGGEGEQGDGRSDYLTVTEVQTNNKQIEQLNRQLQNINENIKEKQSTVDQAASGDTMMNGTRVEGEDNVTMEEAMSDPEVRKAGVESLNLQAQRERIMEQIQQLRQRNQNLFQGGGGNQQPMTQQPTQQQNQQSGRPIKSSVFE